MKNVGNIIIVQARQTSKRFPNKVLKKIGGRSICEIILKRLKKCKNINKIIFAIPDNSKNSSSSEIKNDVNQVRQAPNYCRYDFGSDNENILEICLEDKPKCDGYNFAENNWGKCVIE